MVTDLRTIERDSIRSFVQSAADEGYLSGRVLDYGCGKQPYRDIVAAAGGEYYGFDLPWLPANVSGEIVWPPGLDGAVASRDGHETALHSWARANGYFDAVLCTQVIQYVPLVRESHGNYTDTLADWLMDMRVLMDDEKQETLVMTYPTNWPEVEPEDLHRFTKAGMERLLTEAGFEIVRHEARATVKMVGWGSDPRGWAEVIALGYGVIARA